MENEAKLIQGPRVRQTTVTYNRVPKATTGAGQPQSGRIISNMASGLISK
jgi:hypothetical protein